MKTLNTFRAAILAAGAGYLIFSQDHSIVIGFGVLQVVTFALAIGALLLTRIPKLNLSLREIAIPSAIALGIFGMTVLFGGQYEGEDTDELFAFRSIVFLFVVGIAVYEFISSMSAKPEDVLELRISSALGIITGLVFYLAPLDDLNAVGFFSAYLALSAVQRGVWAASPTDRKKTSNG